MPCVHPICSPRDGGGVWFARPVVVVVLQRLPPLPPSSSPCIITRQQANTSSRKHNTQALHTPRLQALHHLHHQHVKLARGVASGVVLDAACSARRASVQQSHQQPSHHQHRSRPLQRCKPLGLTPQLPIPSPSKLTGWRHQSVGRLCKMSLRPAGIQRYVQWRTRCLSPIPSLPSATSSSPLVFLRPCRLSPPRALHEVPASLLSL